ncbi:Coenzyme F420 hydrogenase/dehydrogenase, beta subunit C-terminal domain [Flavobacterium caseinilyticum]|uniref:Coenzyme F420 hydrogenase n=1 Tax=Flavobacterium caseinilyticum TaxID=2541732 RepID=A0A4R5B1X2_9FLAO|nr:Coenzyme F420 hydrogenase/dehydrogenase, beta subunit C-terminal domain [Flavobacterium caseinilyticum]TDD77022.1 coenzyme F420 hydrogenase [Flavobacterium caseinilyticum]
MKNPTSIQEIVKQELCTGCGICVSESPSSLKMQWNEYGFLTPHQIGDNINDNAIRVCPFNPSPDDEVKDEDKLADIYLKGATNYDPKVGRFENTYVGYSNEYREVASSGGLATYIFKKLLEDRIVDYLFIVKEVEGTYKYQFFNQVNDIIKISKTRYIPVSLEELFLKINEVDGKVAVSGVACFIKAIRLKQYYNPELKLKIPFLVGIICGGLKSKFFTDYLAQNSGINEAYSKQEYRIKDKKSLSSDYSFGAYDEKNNFHQMKMNTVGDMWGTGLFKSNACDFCTDVLTELADVSLGDAWLEEYRNEGLGNSVVVTRSKLADQIVRKGIRNGSLCVTEISKEKIIASQASSFIHRQDAIDFRIKTRKFKNKLVPSIRRRNLKSISLPFKLVQLQRQRTRKMSLTTWRQLKDHKKFKISMKYDLKLLILLTKINHKLRKRII